MHTRNLTQIAEVARIIKDITGISGSNDFIDAIMLVDLSLEQKVLIYNSKEDGSYSYSFYGIVILAYHAPEKAFYVRYNKNRDSYLFDNYRN